MQCPIVSLFAKCSCCAGHICAYCWQLTFSAVTILLGALLTWGPKKAIDIQAALYRPFNWKLEPISMDKAIKDVRRMGIWTMALGIVAIVCLILY